MLTFAAAKLALASLGALLLAWQAWLDRRERPAAARVVVDRGLAALGVLGLLAYVNFGRVHEGRLVHVWDTYHYYVGAKYFPELGYDLLYGCTAVADAEAGLRHDVATRTMTDLSTNLQVRTFDFLIHPERCLERFSPPRWAEFQRDVAYFRDRVSKATWRRIQRDHGYNATPVGNAVGHLLANLAPASDLSITCLVLLDPALLAAGLLLLAWAFGWRASALAALMLGTFQPAQFHWTGGSFLRFDWVFCMLAGISALKKERPFLGGAVLACAALLRLFPAALLVGPALVALDHARRSRSWDRLHLRVFAGAAVAIAVVLPPALLVSGERADGFVANTMKHAATPLTNHIGLPTLLSYRPDSTVRQLREQTSVDLWPRYKQARRDALGRAFPAILAAGLLVLWLVVRAARGEMWRAAVLSLALVPALLELTAYYYVLVIAWATLAARPGRSSLEPGLGAVLLAMCAGSMALALGLFPHVGMDQGHAALGLVTIVGLGAVLGLAGRRVHWRVRASRWRARGSGGRASPDTGRPSHEGQPPLSSPRAAFRHVRAGGSLRPGRAHSVGGASAATAGELARHPPVRGYRSRQRRAHHRDGDRARGLGRR
jgi:hypothetical protein